MSSQEFILKGCNNAENIEHIKKILNILNKYNEHDSVYTLEHLSADIKQISGKEIQFAEYGRSWSFHGNIEIDDLDVHVDAGSSVSFDYFESLVSLFLSVGVLDFKARYFDSSTGSTIVWKYKGGQVEDEEIELENKHIVFSGKMMEGTREEMEEMAEDEGAIIQKAVNGKTEILVVGANVGQKKLQKAKELNIKIITEEEFMELIEFSSDCM